MISSPSTMDSSDIPARLSSDGHLVQMPLENSSSTIPSLSMTNAFPLVEELRRLIESIAFQDAAIIAVGTGLATYYVFKRYEPNSISSLLVLLVAVPGAMVPLLTPHFSNVLQAIILAFVIHLGTIAGSVVAYRLSPLHPLARVPGPILNKLSKWTMVYISSKGKQHLYYQHLHAKYGDIVRTGPNEVSIIDAGSVAPLMGGNGWPKGPNWDGRIPRVPARPMIALRSAKEHARRRQFWNRAFTSAALKDYEPIVMRRATQLLDQLERRKDGVDLAAWCSFFAYDFMSDMVFSGGTDMLHDEDKGGLWHLLEAAQPPSLLMGHVPWFAPYYMKFHGVSEAITAHLRFTRKRGINRTANGSVTKDLYYYLNDEGGFEKERPPAAQAIGDAGLATVAGSDTTSGTLANLFFNLMTHPKAYQRLQEEIDRYYPPGQSPFNAPEQAKLHYLNAVINETLRLSPAVLSGSQRSAEKGQSGKVLAGHYCPPGTQALIHTYTMQRDARYFYPEPESFIPERWLPADEPGSLHSPDYKGQVKHNTAAFIPFSFGPSSCVGKNLAYQEMRMVVASFVQRFDFRLADGFQPETWVESLQDVFVLLRGPLPVVLAPRTKMIVMHA